MLADAVCPPPVAPLAFALTRMQNALMDSTLAQTARAEYSRFLKSVFALQNTHNCTLNYSANEIKAYKQQFDSVYKDKLDPTKNKDVNFIEWHELNLHTPVMVKEVVSWYEAGQKADLMHSDNFDNKPWMVQQCIRTMARHEPHIHGKASSAQQDSPQTLQLYPRARHMYCECIDDKHKCLHKVLRSAYFNGDPGRPGAAAAYDMALRQLAAKGGYF